MISFSIKRSNIQSLRTDIQTDRPTDRQTNRQTSVHRCLFVKLQGECVTIIEKPWYQNLRTDRQAGRQAGTLTDRQTDRQTDECPQMPVCCKRNLLLALRSRGIKSAVVANRQTDRHFDRQDRQDRQTDRQTSVHRCLFVERGMCY